MSVALLSPPSLAARPVGHLPVPARLPRGSSDASARRASRAALAAGRRPEVAPLACAHPCRLRRIRWRQPPPILERPRGPFRAPTARRGHAELLADHLYHPSRRAVALCPPIRSPLPPQTTEEMARWRKNNFIHYWYGNRAEEAYHAYQLLLASSSCTDEEVEPMITLSVVSPDDADHAVLASTSHEVHCSLASMLDALKALHAKCVDAPSQMMLILETRDHRPVSVPL